MLSPKEVKSATQHCLDQYVRIYYFFPLLQEREVKGIRLDREVYAVLWICATLIKERKDDYCVQLDLHNVFRWWNPDYSALESKRRRPDAHFSRLLKMLEDNKYIARVLYNSDRRTREIRITRKGSRLLADINKQRESSIESLFKLVKDEEQLKRVMDGIDAIAHFTWKTMRSYKVPRVESTAVRSSKSSVTGKKHSS